MALASAAMTREAALRIGLAIRELPGIGVPALVHGVAEHLGLPLTEAKLARLSVDDLRGILAGDEVGCGMDELKRAVRLLWGDGVEGSDLPACIPAGDLPGSVRVACASNRGEHIDGHFGSCERFLVYQVSPDEARLIAVRPTLEADQAEDRNLARARLIADCQLAYFQSIGGPAAAKVIREGVHPIKLSKKPEAGESNDEPNAPEAALVFVELQRALLRPPPWLAKVMGVEAASLQPYRSLDEADAESLP